MVAAVCAGVFGQQFFVAGKAVDDIELVGRIGEEKVLMLGMDVDEPYGEIAQDIEGYGRVVYERARTSAGGYLAP